MFSCRVLLSKKLSLISSNKQQISLLKKQKCSLQRDFSSTIIRQKDDSTSESPSSTLMKIKKYVKLNNISYQEGPTNLKTSCPVCEGCSNKDIFINKTTGDLCKRFSFVDA